MSDEATVDKIKELNDFHFVAPKSICGDRAIAMPACVAEVLRSHRARQAKVRLAPGSDWQDFGLVFTTRNGTPIEPRRLDTEFKCALEKANLPEKVRLHDSRHFALSLLAALGVHPRTAQQIAGHSDVNLTMNVYTHVDQGMMREAADKIDIAFGTK